MSRPKPNDAENPFNTGDYEDPDRQIVRPVFVTDKKGRVFCRKHSYVASLEDSGYPVCLDDNCTIPGGESMLSCTTCAHYFNDDCYFPKKTIDEIEQERRRVHIKCELCGERIHRSPVVFQKLYYKDVYNVDMPLICCGCYASLRDDQFIERTRTKILLMTVSIIISVFFLINYFFTIFFLTQWGIVVLIAPILFWGWAAWKDAKRVYYAYRGKKYYEKIADKIDTDDGDEAEEAPSVEEEYPGRA